MGPTCNHERASEVKTRCFRYHPACSTLVAVSAGPPSQWLPLQWTAVLEHLLEPTGGPTEATACTARLAVLNVTQGGICNINSQYTGQHGRQMGCSSSRK